LLDPVIHLRELKGQIDETIELCRQRVARGERALVTTLTKKTAEDLSEYLQKTGLKVRYIHADIDTVERVEILRQLRAGACDVLVGINLLREGLDLPEVSLVCILDADKEGFLRNDTSLIQTAGRAARHVNGECYLFCDTVTDSIQALLNITTSRRERQMAYNQAHGITPRSVVRAVQESLQMAQADGDEDGQAGISRAGEDETIYDKAAVIAQLEKQMREASAQLEFELAAHLRDQIKALQEGQGQLAAPPLPVKRKKK
jgi:excinuclease ABC subunit B